MLDPGEWLAGLERFAPYHLELTGGEPSLYPGLAELLAGLHEGCAWSITSNLLTEAALRLPLEHCASFTASWHGSPIPDFLRRPNRRTICSASATRAATFGWRAARRPCRRGGAATWS